MTKNISEEELLLRKRARRRLLGAIALVLVAVIVLPMVFDQPKPVHQQAEIDVNVAGVDETLAGDAVSSIETLPEVETSEMSGLTEHVPDKLDALNGEQSFIESLDVVQDETDEVVGIESTPIAVPTVGQNNILIPGIKPNPVPVNVAEREAVQNNTVAVVEPSEKIKNAAKEGFIIQLGAFSDHMKAKQQQQNLVSNGINAYTEIRMIDNNEITRVRIGPFATKSAAEQELSKLMKLGLNGVVTIQ